MHREGQRERGVLLCLTVLLGNDWFIEATRFRSMSGERFAGQRNVRRSMWMLVGVPLGIAFLIVWTTFVKTSPTVADDERVRGWETVFRELPATLFLVMVVFLGLFFAVRAGRQGAVAKARRAIWFHGAALFLILLIVVGGSAENVMLTRSATVKWLLFPIEVGVCALAIVVSRRAIKMGAPISGDN